MNTHRASGILKRSLASRIAAVLGVFALLLGALLALVRPWYVSWGATPEELAGRLPGDELSIGPSHETRATNIAAPAALVFAWVSQLGQDRGGFYSYTMLENLVGCQMPDVRHLDPTLQRWSVGDRLWMYPPGELGGMGHAEPISWWIRSRDPWVGPGPSRQRPGLSMQAQRPLRSPEINGSNLINGSLCHSRLGVKVE